MDRFLLAENPMTHERSHKIYIMHTQQPQMLIRCLHDDGKAIGDNDMFINGYYDNGTSIESVTLVIEALLICEPNVSEELKERCHKVLNKAWHWYIAYLKFEDNNINDRNNTKLN